MSRSQVWPCSAQLVYVYYYVNFYHLYIHGCISNKCFQSSFYRGKCKNIYKVFTFNIFYKEMWTVWYMIGCKIKFYTKNRKLLLILREIYSFRIFSGTNQQTDTDEMKLLTEAKNSSLAKFKSFPKKKTIQNSIFSTV